MMINRDKKTKMVNANGFHDKYNGRLSNKNISRMTMKKNLENENPKKIPTVIEMKPSINVSIKIS